MNDYRIIYQTFLDTHKRSREANYLKYAFEDTVTAMVTDDHMSPEQARETLNQLMPDINALNKIKDAS